MGSLQIRPKIRGDSNHFAIPVLFICFLDHLFAKTVSPQTLEAVENRRGNELDR